MCEVIRPNARRLSLGKGVTMTGKGEEIMAKQKIRDVKEQKRLNDAREKGIPWKKWGLAEIKEEMIYQC